MLFIVLESSQSCLKNFLFFFHDAIIKFIECQDEYMEWLVCFEAIQDGIKSNKAFNLNF